MLQSFASAQKNEFLNFDTIKMAAFVKLRLLVCTMIMMKKGGEKRIQIFSDFIRYHPTVTDLYEIARIRTDLNGSIYM